MQYLRVSVYVRSMQWVELCIIIITLIEGYSHLTRTKPDQLHVICMHLLIFVCVSSFSDVFKSTCTIVPRALLFIFVLCNVSNYSDTCLN